MVKTETDWNQNDRFWRNCRGIVVTVCFIVHCSNLQIAFIIRFKNLAKAGLSKEPAETPEGPSPW